VLEVSLGYYINPLVNVLLGVAVLRERLSPWQGLAVALAAAGVANLALQVEGFPWVSLTLAGTFGVYGLIRKTVRLGSLEGLTVESTAVLPLALGYVLFLAVAGGGSFGTVDLATDGLLLAAGAVTAAPLLAFSSAARRLNYTTVGFFQYIAPTCHFLLAVLAYGEPFARAHLVTFALIWTALAVFSVDGIRAARRRAAG
jgi:chloramphenicol-sensitive protein RarD